MYEQHFGFKRRPFRAVATGADVFVGPQTAKIMQATKLALATPDAVIAVMGPPGTGKTTIVNRALDALETEKLVIRIARMQLGHDEVLDFLLDEMQAQNVPTSTIRKVTLFRRLLSERTSAGVRVIIVLEDAIRIGDDALAEIEALTAADGVGNEGAAMVIMGEPALRDRLDGDALTRLKQRIRAYQFVNPLVAPELQGYLKHCLRLGGGEFDLLFDSQGAAFVHALTDGNPRTANNVVEAVLNAAAARKLPRVDNRFIAAVAESEFGLTAPLPLPVTPSQPAAAAKPEVSKTPAVEPASPAAASPEPATAEPVTPPQAPAPQPAPQIDAAPPKAETPAADPAPIEEPAADDIPELINDTLPDLQILAPELTADSTTESPEAEPETEPEADVLPAVVDSTSDDEHIPTLATTTPEPAPEAPIATDANDKSATGPDNATKPAAAETTAPDPLPDPLPELSPEPSVSADPLPELQLEATGGPTPALDANLESVPELTPEATAEPAPLPELTPEPTIDPVPELSLEPAADPEPEPQQSPAVNVADQAPVAPPSGSDPEPVKDPTLAELKPDFGVLEEGLAHLGEAEDEPAPAVQEPSAEDEEERDPTLPSLPTITLDAAIQENIAEATAALEKHDATIADDTVSEESSDIAAAAPKKPAADAISDTDIKKIASGIRKAKSLEDVDEKMAETLFGAEFSAIAAQVIANPPPPSETSTQPQLDVSSDTTASVPDENQLMQELSLVEDSLASDPKEKSGSGDDAPVLGEPTTDMEKEFLDVYGENALEVSLESDKPNAGMDLSASQRLATVRALNAEQVVPKAALPPKPKPEGDADDSSPQSIEDQITTSMTATLKALSVRPDSANDEDDDEEETPKRGFFSRFRRS